MVEASIPLFSYGTLQQPEVQRALFGRDLDGWSDAMAGWTLASLAIADSEVVALSGRSVHKMARRSGNPADLVRGVVFAVTAAELKAADSYEVAEMKRISVRLVSGRDAFVYVGAGE